MRAVFEVETVDNVTGKTRWVRVEAPSPEDAREREIALGQVVGAVRLGEIIDGEATESIVERPDPHACPRCRTLAWKGLGRSWLVWAGVILLFPIGLLLLFVPPTWRCERCGYAYQSHASPPATDDPSGGGVVTFFRVVLWTVLILMATVFVLLAIAQAKNAG